MSNDLLRKIVQEHYNRYNLQGEPDPQGMEASVYNNLLNRPQVDLMPQGQAPDVDMTPASDVELRELIKEMEMRKWK